MNSETRKIFKTKEEVEKLLLNYPDYRDNDERLVATFWYRQLKNAGINPKEISCMEFLNAYAKNEIMTGADTIVRARAKAQEDNPDLRGLKWKDRHKDGIEVTMEINQQ